MATTRELQLITTLKDNASRQLKGLQGTLQKNRDTFAKMSLAGTAAFAGISYGAKKAVDEAGKAEGSWNKFDTVFGEGADDMKDFVEGLRTEMPSATHEIARMGADLQDLLIPMGLARDEAADLTKGSLDLANKIAAFNDADPSEVLEAMKSGFVGMSEPLRKFGIDASVAALEATAQKEGLIGMEEGFSDLDPTVRRAVQSEALMVQMTNQSADAIEGFEENQDSYIRRTQEMNATLLEVKTAIGEALLPVLDSLVKKFIPIFKRIAEWAKENPKLAKTVIMVSLAIAGIVAVVGTLGLILPSIITGFSAVGAVLGFILSPIGLVVGAVIGLIALAALIIKNWGKISDFFRRLWGAISEVFRNKIEGIKEKWTNTWTSMRDFVMGIWDGIKQKITDSIEWIKDKIEAVKNLPSKAISKAKGFATDIGSGIKEKVSGIFPFAEGGIVNKPTLGLLGERGAEAVVPLNKAGGLGNQLVVNINAPLYGIGEREVAEHIANLIFKNFRSEYKT